MHVVKRLESLENESVSDIRGHRAEVFSARWIAQMDKAVRGVEMELGAYVIGRIVRDPGY